MHDSHIMGVEGFFLFIQLLWSLHDDNTDSNVDCYCKITSNYVNQLHITVQFNTSDFACRRVLPHHVRELSHSRMSDFISNWIKNESLLRGEL